MSGYLLGRTALVTGGSRNIGRAITLALAGAGADVAIVARSLSAEAVAVVEDARALGVRALAVSADVGDAEAVGRAVAEVVGEMGPVDVLVSNAAVRPFQGLLEITPAEWDRVVAPNLSATFYLARLVLPSMAERGFGRVIGIGGPDGQQGRANRAHNVACKAGLIGLVKAIATEFGRKGVTANVVVPGITDTSRDPKDYPHWPFTQEQLEQKLQIPRLGRPEEVAEACAFLASERAGYITGQTLHVSGGMVMP